MTLYTAIEEARECLEGVGICIRLETVHDAIDKALASLPEPKTEDELVKACVHETFKVLHTPTSTHETSVIISYLKSAGVLLVRE